MRWMVLVAGLLGAAGVMVGAYAAHGLEAGLLEQGISVEEVAKRLEQCDVAVHYHMLHTLALLILGLLAYGSPRRCLAAAAFFLLGIGLFSGGLYSMVFLGEMGHWAIVPSGGLCFILGWLCVASISPSLAQHQ